MAIIEAYKPAKPLIDWNEKFKTELQGDLTDEEARATLGKFLMYNIGFTVQALTGIQLARYQRLIIKGWFARNFVLNVAGRGAAKCLDENGLVLTENGFKKIKDTYVGEKIWADTGMEIIEDKWINDEEDGYEIKTNRGFTCRGKKGHKIKILNPDTYRFEWRDIEDITGREIIPIRYGMDTFGEKPLFEGWSPRVYPSFSKPFVLPNENDFAYFLGLLTGDGHLEKGSYSFNIVNEDPEIIDFFTKQIKIMLPESAIKTYLRHPNNPKVKTIRSSSVALSELLAYTGVDIYANSPKKIYPARILSGSRQVNINFIRGLFDTDGYASLRYSKERNRYSCEVAYVSTSYELIKTVQAVLLNLGMVFNLDLCHKAQDAIICGVPCQTKDAWRISARNEQDIQLFSDTVGFGIKRKQETVNEYLQKKITETNYHRNPIIGIGIYIKNKYGCAFRRKTGNKIFPSPNIVRLKEMLDSDFMSEEDNEMVRGIIDSNYYYDSVAEITPIKVKTIDIQVANQHSYWSDGFINHNSTCASIFAYLYCLFNPGQKILIVSATFRSSRQVVEKIDGWSKRKGKGELLRQTFDGDMVKRQDLYEVKFQNGSSIIAVPLGDSNKLRGFRCNVLIIDEGLLISQNTIETVLKPFLIAGANITEKQAIRARENRLISKGKMTENQRMVFTSDSKMIVLSSASYTFEYLYTMYKDYLGKIYKAEEFDETGNRATYLVQQFSYEIVPEEILDPAVKQDINSGSTPQEVLDREYKAIFTQGMDGYFSARKMKKCTIEDGKEPCVELVGERGAKYILAIDPNMSSSASADHFAMCLLKIVTKPNGKEIGLVVHQYAVAGVELKHHIHYLSYLLNHFNIVYIACDTTQGDQLDFINICNESEIFKQQKINLLPIEAEFNKEEYDPIVKGIRLSYSLENRKIVQKQSFTSQFQRAANEHLKACFDFENVMFAGRAQAMPAVMDALSALDIGGIHQSHPAFSLDVEKGNNMYDFIENQDALIELVQRECSLIQVSSSQLGNISYDLPQSMKRNKQINRPRKDNYSALFLSVWALRLYLDAMKLDVATQDDSWAPFLI